MTLIILPLRGWRCSKRLRTRKLAFGADYWLHGWRLCGYLFPSCLDGCRQQRRKYRRHQQRGDQGGNRPGSPMKNGKYLEKHAQIMQCIPIKAKLSITLNRGVPDIAGDSPKTPAQSNAHSDHHALARNAANDHLCNLDPNPLPAYMPQSALHTHGRYTYLVAGQPLVMQVPSSKTQCNIRPSS